MRVSVAFTPDAARAAPVAIVVDVMRATSTIVQALASGYRRALCARGIDEARALRDELGEGLLGGERDAVQIPGFDLGASPREFLEPRAETVIFSTTNGTRAILVAVGRSDVVLLGSLLNLEAVARAACEERTDVTIVCAGFEGTFALDDAYCAGRIVQLLEPYARDDPAIAAELVARSFATPLEGVKARTYGPPGLEADLAWCARESVLEVVPRFSRMVGSAAEILP